VTDDLRFGRTRQAHVEGLVATLEQAIQSSAARLRQPKRIGVAERDELRRTLAGAVGICETLRIWLDCGAPQ
jgi:hypothetical protein